MIPVYRPYLPKSALAHAHDAIDSAWLSSAGKYLGLAEAKLKELLGVKHVLLVNNGTSSCHLMSKCLRRKSSKKQIICGNNIYVAAHNSFLMDANDWELIPVDASESSWNVDPTLLEKAMISYPDADVLVVHNVGNVIDVPKLQAAHSERLFVEDSCEGFLGCYGDKLTGTVSLCSAISFFGNKNITSGEGGALITNDDDLYDFAKCTHGQGQSSKRYVHDMIGYNFRMTNIQAALLLGQLEVLPDILEMKSRVFSYYREKFANDERVVLQANEEGTTNANWMFGLRIIGHKDYDAAERFFRNAGVEIRPMFYPMSAHGHLIDHPSIITDDELRQGDKIARQLNEECFILPSFPELKIEEQEHIVATVFAYLDVI
jgi:perosamine synthetase